MKLEQLLLKKEELPILNDTFFTIPIHPKLLSNHIKIDPKIANKVFSAAVKEWHNDLKDYAKTLENKETKDWIKRVFLKKKPQIEEAYGNQTVQLLGWEDGVLTLENGFASSLCISRNSGGTLYLGGSSGPLVLITDETCKFSPEKFLEFGSPIEGLDGAEARVYHQHNVDHYPGALFLRNWAILYLNEAMKQVFKE